MTIGDYEYHPFEQDMRRWIDRKTRGMLQIRDWHRIGDGIVAFRVSSDDAIYRYVHVSTTPSGYRIAVYDASLATFESTRVAEALDVPADQLAATLIQLTPPPSPEHEVWEVA